MSSDLDAYRTANILIREHGQEAPIQAAMRADAMLEKGDMDRYAVSKPIVKAVQWLFREETRGEASSMGKLLL